LKCLDTTFLIDLLRGEHGAVAKSKELNETGIHATTSINVFELVYGIHRSKRTDHPTRIAQAQRIFNRLLVLPLNYDAASKAGEVLGELAREGKEISALDGLTACIALTHGCKVIVTRNVRDFKPIPEIQIETY
jgi:predicted nucleic acid-binding protein